MAKLLKDGVEWFGEYLGEDHRWAQLPPPRDFPQPLSQEWFRAHPQWATDRLMGWHNIPIES